MARLIFDPEAKFEIREAAAYYEAEREGLGKEFLALLEKTTTAIAAHPQRYRKIGGRFRRCLMPRFPYGIIYWNDGDTVFVIAVMHLHRKPGYWKSRIPRA